MTIESTNEIASIDADTIYANITNTNNGIYHLDTSVGDFVGSISAHSIRLPIGYQGEPSPGMHIAGWINADITLAESIRRPIVADGLSANKTIKVAYALRYDTDYPGEIDFGANGLVGQVILNASIGGNPPYWQGDVKINGTALSPKGSYTQLSGNIGGGAVGLVPFQCHYEDCFPPHNYAYMNGPPELPNTSNGILIRHYGPVEWSSTPMTVSYRPVGGGGWTDQTSEFDFNYYSGTGERGVAITLKAHTPPYIWHIGDYEYRVQPTSALKCKGINVANTSVGSYDYRLVLHNEDSFGGGGDDK